MRLEENDIVRIKNWRQAKEIYTFAYKRNIRAYNIEDKLRYTEEQWKSWFGRYKYVTWDSMELQGRKGRIMGSGCNVLSYNEFCTKIGMVFDTVQGQTLRFLWP